MGDKVENAFSITVFSCRRNKKGLHCVKFFGDFHIDKRGTAVLQCGAANNAFARRAAAEKGAWKYGTIRYQRAAAVRAGAGRGILPHWPVQPGFSGDGEASAVCGGGACRRAGGLRAHQNPQHAGDAHGGLLLHRPAGQDAAVDERRLPDLYRQRGDVRLSSGTVQRRRRPGL